MCIARLRESLLKSTPRIYNIIYYHYIIGTGSSYLQIHTVGCDIDFKKLHNCIYSFLHLTLPSGKKMPLRKS